MDTAYRVYLDNGDKTKTISVSHPKLEGVNGGDYQAAGNALEGAYGLDYDHTGLVSETTVHAAG
ncbi:MAG: hypothetical protein IJ862_03435 [Selenomonadaceae bacterium]|nr:hypothetical protein [Selenomonadaceae bacterium]